MPAGGSPGRGRDWTGATQLRERGFGANPVRVIAEDDQQLGRGVGAHTEALTEGHDSVAREVLVVYRNFLGESHPRRASARRVCLADAVGVLMGPGRSPAQRVSRP